MPRRYPSEFRRRVLDLVASGRTVASVAEDLDVSDQMIYTRRRHRTYTSGQRCLPVLPPAMFRSQ